MVDLREFMGKIEDAERIGVMYSMTNGINISFNSDLVDVYTDAKNVNIITQDGEVNIPKDDIYRIVVLESGAVIFDLNSGGGVAFSVL